MSLRMTILLSDDGEGLPTSGDRMWGAGRVVTRYKRFMKNVNKTLRGRSSVGIQPSKRGWAVTRLFRAELES